MTSVAAIPSEEGLTAKANTSDHSERQQDCQNGQKTTDDPNGRVRSHGSGVPFLTGSARCCTQPLSKYELVRALGARAAQLARGKRALVMVPGVLDPLEIARAELDAGVLDIALHRVLPDGTAERWTVQELQLLSSSHKLTASAPPSSSASSA